VIAALQHQRDQFLLDIYAAGAHAVQHTLDHVGKAHDLIETEQTTGAFDRVCGAENAIDRFRLVIELLHLEQRRLHVFEQFAAFRREGLQDLLDVHARPRTSQLSAWRRPSRPSNSIVARRLGLGSTKRSPLDAFSACLCAAISNCTPTLSTSPTAERSMSTTTPPSKAVMSAAFNSPAR